MSSNSTSNTTPTTTTTIRTASGYLDDDDDHSHVNPPTLTHRSPSIASTSTSAWTYPTQSIPSSYNASSHPASTYTRRTSIHSDDFELDDETESNASSSSSLDSDSTWTSSRIAYEDELQWQESMRQLQLIWNVVVLPYAAKWAGRKWAYWVFARWQVLGFADKTFWFGRWASTVPETWWPATR